MYYYSGAQLARALVAQREGREIEPHLRRAIAEMPRHKSPLELEVDRLRRELAEMRDDSFVITGFKAPALVKT